MGSNNISSSMNSHTKEVTPPDTDLADSTMQSQVSSRVPLKKRASRRNQMIKHRLKHQGSSSLEPKHREYKKYGHIRRVNFAIFLKILMQHLSLIDKELHAQAKEMIHECIKSQREGKLEGTPLMSALKGRLFGLVGKDIWDESERYLQTYLDYHNIRTDL